MKTDWKKVYKAFLIGSVFGFFYVFGIYCFEYGLTEMMFECYSKARELLLALIEKYL
jgi:hypothetical protein